MVALKFKLSKQAKFVLGGGLGGGIVPVFGASILGHFPPENRPLFSAVAYPRTAGSRCAAPYLSKTPRFPYTISATPRGRGQPRRMEPAASAQGPLATSDGRQWAFTCQSAYSPFYAQKIFQAEFSFPADSSVTWLLKWA